MEAEGGVGAVPDLLISSKMAGGAMPASTEGMPAPVLGPEMPANGLLGAGNALAYGCG